MPFWKLNVMHPFTMGENQKSTVLFNGVPSVVHKHQPEHLWPHIGIIPDPFDLLTPLHIAFGSHICWLPRGAVEICGEKSTCCVIGGPVSINADCWDTGKWPTSGPAPVHPGSARQCDRARIRGRAAPSGARHGRPRGAREVDERRPRRPPRGVGRERLEQWIDHAYTPMGELGRLRVVREDGRLVQELGYDVHHNVVEGVDARGARTAYAYDGVGRAVGLTDALGRSTSVEYDKLGQPLCVRRPDGTERRAAYDGLGNPVRVVDALGQVTEMPAPACSPS
jgi:YD repeat-containing protein